MSVSEVTTENGKITCKTSEASVININISQRSFWDSLADYTNALRKLPSEELPRPPASSNSDVKPNALPAILGVSQLPLGAICITMYIITMTANVDLSVVNFTGALLWMGIPFILSGVFETVSYVKNKTFWVFISFVSQLLNFCVSIAGLVITSESYPYRYFGSQYYYSDDPCQRLLNAAQSKRDQSNDWQMHSYNTNAINSESTWELNACKQSVNQAKDLSCGFLTILLVIGSWGLISSTIAVIYRLKRLCKPCSADQELAEENNEPTEKDSPYTVTV